jgi:hypothetical protein
MDLIYKCNDLDSLMSLIHPKFLNDKEIVTASNSIQQTILPKETSVLALNVDFQPTKLLNTISNLATSFALTPQKVLDVCWKNDQKTNNEMYASRIRVLVENKSGSLADASSIIANKKVNIIHIKTSNQSPDFFEVIIDIEVKNIQHLEEILSSLRISKKVLEVERVFV